VTARPAVVTKSQQLDVRLKRLGIHVRCRQTATPAKLRRQQAEAAERGRLVREYDTTIRVK
jgi:hypothetical protein